MYGKLKFKIEKCPVKHLGYSQRLIQIPWSKYCSIIKLLFPKFKSTVQYSRPVYLSTMLWYLPRCVKVYTIFLQVSQSKHPPAPEYQYAIVNFMLCNHQLKNSQLCVWCEIWIDMIHCILSQNYTNASLQQNLWSREQFSVRAEYTLYLVTKTDWGQYMLPVVPLQGMGRAINMVKCHPLTMYNPDSWSGY